MAQTNAQLDNVTHLAALEIGGSNGMINLIAGSTKYLNLPIIDGDFMGRAYPTGWQTTPNVYDKGDRAEMLLPAAMCSGDGSTVVCVSLMLNVPPYSPVSSALEDTGLAWLDATVLEFAPVPTSPPTPAPAPAPAAVGCR